MLLWEEPVNVEGPGVGQLQEALEDIGVNKRDTHETIYQLVFDWFMSISNGYSFMPC